MSFTQLAIVIGVGATAIMDVWGYARKLLFGVAAPNYKLVGRWIAHMTRGRFRHNAIAHSPSMRSEHAIGWISHYLIGIVFAALLLIISGPSWIQHPTLGPALAVGFSTVAAPFLLMQPGMGLGIAASRAPRPASARLHSVITHGVFGLGLYIAGWVVNFFS